MMSRIPYHVLNTVMIAGGVGFMLNLLELVSFLINIEVLHFLGVIGGAIVLKYIYGFIKPEIKDPITAHSLARKFFLISMGVLVIALIMRKYDLPYYKILLYLDIVIQAVALGISFSFRPQSTIEANEEILDA